MYRKRKRNSLSIRYFLMYIDECGAVPSGGTVAARSDLRKGLHACNSTGALRSDSWGWKYMLLLEGSCYLNETRRAI